jgi:hypothetical protein
MLERRGVRKQADRWVSPDSTHPTTLPRDGGLLVGWVEGCYAETHRLVR